MPRLIEKILSIFFVSWGTSWVLGAVAAALAIFQGNHSATLLYIHLGALILGICLLVVGTFLWRKKTRAALFVLAVSTVLSLGRWLLQWKSVFPFSDVERHKDPDQSLLVYLWQTQHFWISILLLIALVLLAVTGRKTLVVRSKVAD